MSCIIGNSGFSKNGNDGSLKDTCPICACSCEITGSAVINGFVTPILNAFSANACCTSFDNSIGLNILLRIVLTSMSDNLSVAELNASGLIFKT